MFKYQCHSEVYNYYCHFIMVMGGFVMKKGLISLTVLTLLIVAGCIQQPSSEGEEINLIAELQDIERQLQEAEGATGAVVVDADSAENSTAEVDGDNITDGFEELDELIEELENPEEVVDAVEEEILGNLEDLLEFEEVDTSTLQRIEVEETDLVDLKINASDDDRDDIEFLFSPPLDDFGKWQTHYSDAGEYVVTIAASDGEHTVEQKILLVVHKKNVPPSIEDVPEVLDINEGDSVVLTPTLKDLNGDNVRITYSAPLSADGTWETDHTSAGSYDITLTATDGEEATVHKLSLIVNDVNVPPEISGLESSITVKEGETVRIEPVVSDLDNDVVELSISEPVGDDGVWETLFTDNGEYVITVAASDGKDTVSIDVSVTVKDVNVPPKIISIVQG
jgi:hypothetical protein